MPARTETNDRRMRQRLAQEAARLMAEEGVQDFHSAKHKAAARLGVAATRNLPRNDEIEAALVEYQRLFRPHSQAAALERLRRATLQAMRFLASFQPRVVGPVLAGTADAHTPVSLHLFADAPEEVALFLLQKNIPYEHTDRRYTLSHGEAISYPVYRFIAQDTAIDLTIFPINGLREAPRSPVDGRPMARAAVATVEEWLKDS